MIYAIIGSRDFINTELLIEVLSNKDLPTMQEIVSGGARGADQLAAWYAQYKGLPLHEFYPDYEKYGKVAPLIRNAEIEKASDICFAFYSSKKPFRTRGTAYTVELFRKAGKPVYEYWENKK